MLKIIIMCWVGNSMREYANEDIPIFKICDRNYLSVCSVIAHYRGTLYELNKIYDGVDFGFVEVSRPYKKISSGYHSYKPSVEIEIRDYPFNRKNKTIEIKSKKRLLDCYNSYGDIIQVLGYIPKGSEYYENDFGEIVSNKICLTKIVELW